MTEGQGRSPTTLLTAEKLIRAVVRGLARGICAYEGIVHHALLRWYRTQGGVPQMETCNRGLVTDARLRKRRAPGTTCLTALGEARELSLRRSGVDGIVQRPEMRAFGLQRLDNLQKMAQRAGQPIQADHHQRLARSDRRRKPD